MQAETLASAYRLWRREWRGRGREYTAGALVWQVSYRNIIKIDIIALSDLRDLLTVIYSSTTVGLSPRLFDSTVYMRATLIPSSLRWAIVDYFRRPKPAYFAIARELRPYTVGITRKEIKTYADDSTAAFFTIETVIEIWGTNSTLEDKKVMLDVTAFNLDDPTWRDHTAEDVLLKANSSTEFFKGDLPGQPTRRKLSQKAKPIVISARLIDDNGEVLGRYTNW